MTPPRCLRRLNETWRSDHPNCPDAIAAQSRRTRLRPRGVLLARRGSRLPRPHPLGQRHQRPPRGWYGDLLRLLPRRPAGGSPVGWKWSKVVSATSLCLPPHSQYVLTNPAESSFQDNFVPPPEVATLLEPDELGICPGAEFALCNWTKLLTGDKAAPSWSLPPPSDLALPVGLRPKALIAPVAKDSPAGGMLSDMACPCPWPCPCACPWC